MPVGPQVHLSEALDRLRAGQPLAITAPRRFGKSSLLALLERRLSEDAATVTVRVDCNTVTAPDGVQVENAQLWHAVGAALGERLSGAVLGGLDGGRPPLPNGSSFEGVRQIAHLRNISRIVVFLDEAQRLFDAGLNYCSRLRNLLVRELVSTPNMASIAFCFVGLPTINEERLGPDLYPLLNPVKHQELKEDELPRVIRKVASGEHGVVTTKAARIRLAESSWNLYALQTLLRRVLRHVQADGRVWVSVEDVIHAEDTILAELRDGEDPEALNAYIRDSLNGGSSPSEFRPVESFPVAAAYAAALAENRVGADAAAFARGRLNDWSASIFRESQARPFFDSEVFERHLRALVEMRVLDSSRDDRGIRFRSEFLRAYLVGQIRAFLNQPWFGEALMRAGLRSIALPGEQDRQPLGEGRQARAFQFQRGDQRLTARVRELADDQRDAFLQSLGLIGKISRIHEANREGAEGIFKLVDVGLVHRAPRLTAVEIYRYIPGTDLGSSVGKCAPAVVVKIGRALAKALAVVHDHDVLHRDIRPKNVILQDGHSPVLIDFGLACARSTPGGTPLYDEYAANEVQRAPPNWTAAADVFSLATTLRKLQRPTASRDDTRLADALSQFMAPEPENRPNAQALCVAMEELSTTFGIGEREATFRAQLLAKVSGDTHQSDLCALVERLCAPQIAGFALGMYREQQTRMCTVAFVVSKFTERVARRKLAELANEKCNGKRWPDGVDGVIQLRNEFSHAEPARKKFTAQSLLAGVDTIATWLGPEKLPALAQHLLESNPA